MPSSLIIVALAAAWLVVLVPMIARKRQEIARTADSALAARVVRSGSTRHEGREEFAMSETGKRDHDADDDEYDEVDADLEDEVDDLDDLDDVEPAGRDLPPLPQPREGNRQYRPGRGGYDPEAAEIAARAKYAYRQRVVVILLVLAVVTAGLAAFLTPLVWWAHGAIDLVLVGYLAYLRRQVRIESEIRQRRLSRLSAGTRVTRRPARDDEDTMAEPAAPRPSRREVPERKPSPTSRLRRHAVVVDPEDEDPAFHELDDPGQRSFRRAVGE
ncbi:divisome protein SepX/GlpR [Amycolatopsis magusensis]|uniref:Transmembrane protein n=1 Tax=Amycolatopsis magusensis TaxID=882444 RepID=A0ABS4PHJ4_9PSEU|nr:gephyrin-like molybdotransferase receptor GlpR [Amycolatopsis magusensis]MBP2178877.1 hypothetical protein [Amycolatopsis magusensis]